MGGGRERQTEGETETGTETETKRDIYDGNHVNNQHFIQFWTNFLSSGRNNKLNLK